MFRYNIMSDWSKLKLPELRNIATTYNKHVKLTGVSKMKRADLVTELDKHLTIDFDDKGEHTIKVKAMSGSFETKKQAGEKEAKKVFAQYKTGKEAATQAALVAQDKKAAKVTAYTAEPAKVVKVVIGKERKSRSDKGAKHTYPEGRKERSDKGKKRK